MKQPWPHQITLSKEAEVIIKEYMIVYLAMEERTGKSLTALLLTEALAIHNILIVTKKKPLKGWNETLADFSYLLHKKYTLTNYHQLKNYNPVDYDCVILDEAHNYISSFPKASALWSVVKRFTAQKPLIYLSATPHAQGRQMLYHQLALSTWSPWWKYSSFYNWFKTYGKPYTIMIRSKEVNQYDRAQDELIRACTDHLFITKTRKQLGFDHEPKDKLHYIELNDLTKARYNVLVKDKLLECCDAILVADTVIKFRTSLHMLEGGTLKISSPVIPIKSPNIVKTVKKTIEDALIFEHYFVLDSSEKIDYIKATWGDSKDVVIMYNYIGEGIKLRAAFINATILQATSYAEGEDLSMFNHLIIYSQDFSTARHTQRRCRQANKARSTSITVHYLLVKKGISEQVYKTVSINKKNYVDSRFERTKL